MHFSLNYSSIKTVGATVLGGLWALEWAWHIAETNLRCVRSYGICSANRNSLASDPDEEYIYFMGSETLPSSTLLANFACLN